MAYVPRDIGSRVAIMIGPQATKPLAVKIAAKGKALTEQVIKEGRLDADVDMQVRYMGADHIASLSVTTRDREIPSNNGVEIASFLEYGFHSSVWGTYPQGEGPWVEGQHMMRRAALGS